MNARRDELAEAELIDAIRATLEGWPFRKQAAVAAVEVMKSQGWSKPRTVDSVEELEALPRRSVILDADEEGHVWIRGRKGLWHCSCDGDEYAWESADMLEEAGGKFRVLFTPGGEG